DLGVGEDRQVRAPPHGAREISDRGGDTPVVYVADGDRIVSVDELPVLILDIGVAGLVQGPGEGLGVSRPKLLRHARYGDRAALAVERPVEIAVAFKLPEIGTDVFP